MAGVEEVEGAGEGSFEGACELGAEDWSGGVRVAVARWGTSSAKKK